MIETTAEQDRTTEQAAKFNGLLADSRELACRRLAGAVSAMLAKAVDALDTLSAETQNRDARSLYQDARKLVVAEGGRLETEFRKFYLIEFRNRITLVRDPAHTFPEQVASLKLVGDDDLEETLAFREMAGKLRRYCEEELAALDQRVGVLLGDANLNADMNPFSPQAICDAYQQACRALGTGTKVRGVLLKLFDDHVIDELRSIYKDVNALLVKNAILPKIRYGASRKARGKPAAAEASGTADAAGSPEAAGSAEANLFSLLQGLVARNGGLAAGTATQALPPGHVPLQGVELIGSLTQIQQGGTRDGGTGNVLRELKATSVGASMAQMDAMTLDIVAMLFDQLFDDPRIPIGLKGLIGRMQIPMLKVAIADKAFFSKKTHPARQVLDVFGELALRLPAEFGAGHPLFAQVEEIVQQLIDGFQDDMAIFSRVGEQLRSLIAQEDRRVEVETRAVAERAAQAESLAVAKTAAEEEVRSRVQAHKLPGFVLEFIVEHWLRLLLLIHAKAGSGSAGWRNALGVMDHLVWSVEPKATPEERRSLAAALPPLVRNIGAGLDALGVNEEARAGFFAALMKVHTDILGATAKARGAAAPQAPAAEAPLKFTAEVTVRNPYGGGQVQVTGLDFSATGPKSGAAESPDSFAIGTWVEFRPKSGEEKRRAAKVLFVTPKKSRYVFSDRNGKNMLELSRGELVRRLRSGELARLDEAPEGSLFDRIMSGVVERLRVPVPRAA